MNAYIEMQNRQQNEFNAFPAMFAFNEKQFAEGMAKLGLNPEETDKIFRGIGGMYYRKTDAPELHAMMERFDREKAEAVASDTTGEGFIFQMFLAELENHEYSYTGDPTDAVAAAGYSLNEIFEDEKLAHGLSLAMEKAMRRN